MLPPSPALLQCSPLTGYTQSVSLRAFFLLVEARNVLLLLMLFLKSGLILSNAPVYFAVHCLKSVDADSSEQIPGKFPLL